MISLALILTMIGSKNPDWFCLKTIENDLVCADLSLQHQEDDKVYLPSFFTLPDADLKLREGSVILSCKKSTITGCSTGFSKCIPAVKCKDNSPCKVLLDRVCGNV